MQPNILTTLAFLILSHFSVEVLANSGYAASCTNIQIYPPDGDTNFWAIAADCTTAAQQPNLNTKIDIDSCFSNSNGSLIAQLK